MGQFWVKTIALSGSVLGDRQQLAFALIGAVFSSLPIACNARSTTLSFTSILLIALMSPRCFSKLRDVTRRGKLLKLASIKLPCAKSNSLSKHNFKLESAVIISCRISSASSQRLSHFASSDSQLPFFPCDDTHRHDYASLPLYGI